MDTKLPQVLMWVLITLAAAALGASIIEFVIIGNSHMYSDVQQIQQQEECMDVDDRVVLPNE